MIKKIDYSGFLIISGHDYRSQRKANMHFIARELAIRAPTRFFSIGFSFISKLKKDSRLSLWPRSNQVEKYEDVDCYLWRTLLHPFNIHYSWLRSINDLWFKLYLWVVPPVLLQWIRSSDVIVLESGMSPILFGIIKKTNAKAEILYNCSDSLETIDCAPFIVDELKRVSPHFSGIRIPSAYLRSEFAKQHNVFVVPHGMDPISSMQMAPSPYNGGINIISVGQMLFDRTFFEVAAEAFPEINFHIVGGGPEADKLSFANLTIHPEMNYSDTLPYLKYANIGVAPYKVDKVAKYLVDSSMKLAQFGAIGLPSVCPDLVAGSYPDRFGYIPGDRGSILVAVRQALKFGRFEGRCPLSWKQVVDRILNAEIRPDSHFSQINTS